MPAELIDANESFLENLGEFIGAWWQRKITTITWLARIEMFRQLDPVLESY